MARRIRAFLGGVLFLIAQMLIGTGAPACAADRTTIVFPPDLTLSSEATIRIFAFRDGKDAPLSVFVNGKSMGTLEGGAFQKGEVPLNPGLNRIQAGPRSTRVYSLPGTAAKRFSLSTGKGNPPLIFRPVRLHPALDDGCDGCHLLKDGKLGRIDQKTACYACHENFEKTTGEEKRYLHEPVANGECTSCHAPHYSTLPKLQKDIKGCFACHDPFPVQGTVHRPVKSGRCTECHNPHVGLAPKQLVRNGNDLCTGCHRNFHVHHRGEAVAGSMTRLPPDIQKDGRSLSCLACHAPHQSTRGQLLLKTREELCRTCHPR